MANDDPSISQSDPNLHRNAYNRERDLLYFSPPALSFTLQKARSDQYLHGSTPAVRTLLSTFDDIGTIAKVDVHHHILPDFYEKLIALANIPVGTSIPHWSPEVSLDLMDKLHIGTAVLSLSAPGAMIAGDADQVRRLAGRWDEYAAEKLNERHAVVHVHPIHSREAPFTTPFLPQPLIDYPHESARTASDMLLSGRKRQVPNCVIIPSHAGGPLLIISERLVSLSNTVFVGLLDKNPPRGDEMLEDLKSFYFDLAISGSANVLDTLLEWAP
ncbi:MAG: hypothetical protein Q9207_006887 [Kuettlingeria erythrocarpa]